MYLARNLAWESSFLFQLIFVNQASIYAVLFSSLHLLLNKDSFIAPASIYAVLFSSLHILLNKDSFTLQLLFIQYCFHHSIFYLIKILSSLQLLFMQHCFHHSSFFLYRILFINPASISVKSNFNKSHFCWCKPLANPGAKSGHGPHRSWQWSLVPSR